MIKLERQPGAMTLDELISALAAVTDDSNPVVGPRSRHRALVLLFLEGHGVDVTEFRPPVTRKTDQFGSRLTPMLPILNPGAPTLDRLPVCVSPKKRTAKKAPKKAPKKRGRR